MGLAASQARFLAITSRKAYCEFQSMQIAQDKLSVTRDLAEISNDYQNALNKTKLVWDFDGSGENMYNLSYGVLMTPSALNNYTPYLITTRTGAVVLNGPLAAAAASAISASGASTSRSEAGYKKFIEALVNEGVIAKSTSEGILNTDELPYDKDAGYGSTPLNKNGVTATSIVGLIYKAKENGVDENGVDEINIGKAIAELLNEDSLTLKENGNTLKIMLNNKELTRQQIEDLTLDQLFTNEVILMEQGEDGEHEYSDLAIEEILSKIFGIAADKLAKILGIDPSTDITLITAKEMTESQFNNEYVIQGKRDPDSRSWQLIKENSNINQIIYHQNNGAKNNNKFNSSAGVNLTNMISYYLTEYELLLNGYDSDYILGPTAEDSYFVTDDPYYNYLTKDDDAIDNMTIMQADFYMQLYNNICINGWTQNNNVDDEKYLENALKNGTYFITSLNGDGYFYQGRYNEEDCIVEITDQDAIAQAEAEFTTKKAQLTYKEEQLDLEMKNLDTEISSLTTEYDSVKNLISKNVEKIFNMFQ